MCFGYVFVVTNTMNFDNYIWICPNKNILSLCSYGTDHMSSKLSSLLLMMPAFDSVEFPLEMPMGILARYAGTEFSMDGFMLQCEFYAERLATLNLIRGSG